MAVRAVQNARAAPVFAVFASGAETEVIVYVSVLGVTGRHPPGAGIDEQLVVEDQKVRVSDIPIGYAEGMDLLSVGSIGA